MSIRTFNQFVKGGRLFLQTPITGVMDEASNRQLGYAVQIDFDHRKSDRLRDFTVQRVTYVAGVVRGKVQRKLRNHPRRHESVTSFEPLLDGTPKLLVSDYLSWQAYDDSPEQAYKRPSWRPLLNHGLVEAYRTVSDDSLYVDRAKLAMLRNAARDGAPGQMIVDYLAETGFGKYLSGPAWLPNTWVEMRAYEKEVEQARKATPGS